MAASGRGRLLVPEVVQTSAMDCGPAALKCVLEGFGIPVSYGRLREACQTDVDGTSIDTLEALGEQLGLQAEQVMLPADYVMLPELDALPAIVLVHLPNGFTHFVVAWSRRGPVVQIMDPAIGRRLVSRQTFAGSLHLHTAQVTAAAFRQWAASPPALGALARRLSALGLPHGGQRHIAQALADPTWHSLGALEAAARMVDTIVAGGGLTRGRQAARALEVYLAEQTCRRARGDRSANAIPESFWSALSARALDPQQPAGPGDEETLSLRGVVLVTFKRRSAAVPAVDDDDHGATVIQQVPLPPDLAAALTEPPVSPGRQLGKLLLAGGARLPLLLALGIALSAVGVVIEALLFRAFFDGGWSHGLTTQRLAALGALVSLVLVLLLLEVPIVSGLLQLGRSLETRLRMTVLERIPRFDDRYFQSRPTSDMAERSHSLHRIRILPALGGRLLRAICELGATMVALVWLDPSGAGAVVLTGVSTLGFALVVQPLLAERDLRVRTHAGAMSRFYLDALLGLVAVRAHAAERSLRREHESLLVEWVRAGRSFLRIAVGAETGQMLLGFACTGWLFLAYLGRSPHPAGALLLLYWAMNLPLLGNEIAALTRQYPQQRNLMLRLLEWLGVNLDPPALATVPAAPGREPVAITMKAVTVRAAGHDILEDVDLAIPAGSHLAIVGASGSGKSSLVGLLLGWHRPAFGQLLVDGQPLEGARLQELRRDTAWVDPAVQLWNRSLHGNLTYGGQGEQVGRALSGADVGGVLEKLPEGLQSMLGEGGGLLSGGEGQRVRFGRALLRGPARLVVLDEPFRGLDREHRRIMLARARQRWQGVTMLCVTHDLAETAAFPRVLVVDGGRVVEDGAPADLAAQPGSRYRALLDAERALHRNVWASPLWRRLRFDKGGLVETGKAQ